MYNYLNQCDENGENCPTIHNAVHPTVWGIGDQLEKIENTKAMGALYDVAGVEEDAPPPAADEQLRWSEFKE